MSTARDATGAFILAVFLCVKFVTVCRNNSTYASILNVLLHILGTGYRKSFVRIFNNRFPSRS